MPPKPVYNNPQLTSRIAVKLSNIVNSASTESLTEQKMTKLKYIDALRGFAILGVIIRHNGDNGSNQHLPTLLKYAILNGNAGVGLFYFISAYTLMLSMHSRVNLESNFIGNFYLRRLFRIAPMFYLAIVYYIWQNIHATSSLYSTANIFSHVFFAHGFSPEWINSVVPGGWSVADEVLFYAILPILFYKITTLQKATILFLATLVLRFVLDFLSRKCFGPNDAVLATGYLNFYLPGQFPVFALGIVFYFLVKNKFELLVSPAIILSFGIILMINFLGILLLPQHVLFVIAFFIITIALSKRNFNLLVNPLISFIGKISYSMYLSHFAVIFWLSDFGFIDPIPAFDASSAIMNYTIRLVLILGITILVSSFFYFIVEIPMQKFGYRFLKKNKAKPSI